VLRFTFAAHIRQRRAGHMSVRYQRGLQGGYAALPLQL